jgi:L-lactate dehydrogenase
MPELKPFVSIIGGGNVGTRYAYALMMRGIARRIVLVDIDRDRADGEALDLSHGAPYVSPVHIRGGDYPDIAGSDLVVITAGKKQKPGQSRLELTKANVELYSKIVPAIVKHAPDAILLVVSNPVDVLSYAAYKFSSSPPERVIGSGTVLDSARFRHLISDHCKVDPRNVHAYILGEHGDSEFPVWSRAMIGGTLLNDYCPICDKTHGCRHENELNDIFVEVRDSAYRIIEKKGETSYGIGLALVRITEAILRDENSILPVSTLMKRDDGQEVYLSLPAVVNRQGVRQVVRLDLNPEEKQGLANSARVIGETIRKAGL